MISPMIRHDDDPHWREAALRYLRAVFRIPREPLVATSHSWQEITMAARDMMRVERGVDLQQ